MSLKGRKRRGNWRRFYSSLFLYIKQKNELTIFFAVIVLQLVAFVVFAEFVAFVVAFAALPFF